MSTELSLYNKDSFDSAVKIAQTLAKSKMVPVALQGRPEDIFAILVLGAEIGVPPMTALQSISVIQGKPTVSPLLMIAMVKGKLPGCVIDIKSNPATETVTCQTARSKEDLKDGLFYTSSWDMKKADKMGLTAKDNYKKQAETMLRWRAVAESCRVTFPDIILGLYLPEEFQDFDGRELPTNVSKNESKDMLDTDFPIPDEEKEVGDLYRVQNGTFRGQQLKDIPLEEMAEYREKLIKRTTPKKDWEFELIQVFGMYLNTIEGELASE